MLRSESKLLPAGDLGGAINKSPAGIGIGAQKRNLITTDLRLRGKNSDQIPASGSYWVPARLDLDTMLSKIDPRLVEKTVVIKGPFSARYGPGFAFIDFEFLTTPRFSNGGDSGGSSSIEYQTNGDRFYARQEVWTGTEDFGARVTYGNKTGKSYETGLNNGSVSMIPGGYDSRDVNAAIGWDPQPGHRIELNYLRLDQTGIEFPGQILDIDQLQTDAGEVTYTIADHAFFDFGSFETWYNRTQFVGDNLAAGKRRQIPLFNDVGLTYLTDVLSISAGYDFNLSWGSAETTQTTAGIDLRHIHQKLDEFASSICWVGTTPTRRFHRQAS
jgi:iron complex outermembrane recepter protein